MLVAIGSKQIGHSSGVDFDASMGFDASTANAELDEPGIVASTLSAPVSCAGPHGIDFGETDRALAMSEDERTPFLQGHHRGPLDEIVADPKGDLGQRAA